MMHLHLVRSALLSVKRAEDLIVSEMAANGIPGPAAIIHNLRDEDEPLVDLYSSALVFACGVRRLRRRRNVRVIYGDQVTEAIAMAERFIRRGKVQ